MISSWCGSERHRPGRALSLRLSTRCLFAHSETGNGGGGRSKANGDFMTAMTEAEAGTLSLAIFDPRHFTERPTELSA
jgi:hypothetical protein